MPHDAFTQTGTIPIPEPVKPAPHWYDPPQVQKEYVSELRIIEWSNIIPEDPGMQRAFGPPEHIQYCIPIPYG
jgi:hypothetical protein